MVDIVFTVPNMTGGAVTVSATVIYGTEHSNERINQVSQRTLDGYRNTWDSGVTIVSTMLKLKNLSKTDGDALRTWLRTKAVFSLKYFTITTPDGVDLGLGEGTDITDAKFTATNDSAVFAYRAPGVFDVNFPFEFVRV